MAQYNEKGQEIPDPTPIELPIGYKAPETLESMISRMVRVHSLLAVKEGLESFEESDDFDDDENEMTSPYQMTQMQEENPKYKPSLLKTDQKKEKPTAEPAEPAAALKSAGDRRQTK